MGCDGGTIPRRDELVKTKKKAEEKDKDANLAAKWQYCVLSCTKLRRPIVSCDLGQLYNKDSVIEFLLNRDTFTTDVATHVRNLKDVIELQLTEKPDYIEKAGNGGEYVDCQASRFICPVVGLDMSGKYKFCYLRKCGCVVSERALKEVKSDNCHKCGAEFDSDDLVVINGSSEEVAMLKVRMEERRATEKSSKKAARKRKIVSAAAASEVKSQDQSSDDQTVIKKEEDKIVALKSKTTKHFDVAGPSRSAKTTKTSTDSMLSDKAKGDYSVAKDPNATEIYKSIFTTHKTAINQQKAHWVTYNPLYF